MHIHGNGNPFRLPECLTISNAKITLKARSHKKHADKLEKPARVFMFFCRCRVSLRGLCPTLKIVSTNNPACNDLVCRCLFITALIKPTIRIINNVWGKTTPPIFLPKKKPSLHCKEAFFMSQTRLVYTARKPCLQHGKTCLENACEKPCRQRCGWRAERHAAQERGQTLFSCKQSFVMVWTKCSLFVDRAMFFVSKVIN